MDYPTTFPPERRRGVVFQAVASLVLLVSGGYSLLQAIQARSDSNFLLYLSLSIILLTPLLPLVYRLYSLLGARYSLERDGLRLRWGLRSEDIPLTEIEWLRPMKEMAALVPGHRLPLPWLLWPGAIIGSRQAEGLGAIEYLASGMRTMLLVATPQRIYAISPADPAAFIQAFNRAIELGSLTPLLHGSVYPSFLLARLWSNRPARALILGGVGLGLALLAGVALAIPSRATVSLGFAASGAALDPSPSNRLLLLPVLNTFAFLVDLAGGMYFFRREHSQPVAYLLWAAGAFTPLLMLVGLLMMATG